MHNYTHGLLAIVGRALWPLTLCVWPPVPLSSVNTNKIPVIPGRVLLFSRHLKWRMWVKQAFYSFKGQTTEKSQDACGVQPARVSCAQKQQHRQIHMIGWRKIGKGDGNSWAPRPDWIGNAIRRKTSDATAEMLLYLLEFIAAPGLRNQAGMILHLYLCGN